MGRLVMLCAAGILPGLVFSVLYLVFGQDTDDFGLYGES